MNSQVKLPSNGAAASRVNVMTFPVLKHNRMTEIANENELPIIGLVQAVSDIYFGNSLWTLSHVFEGWCFPPATVSSLPQSQSNVQRPCTQKCKSAAVL